MSAKPLLADWWNNTEKRFEWAYAGIGPFEQKLSSYQSEGVQFDHQLKNLVCVYGRSQVGKTTLILELMGVDDSQHIADVFRGGAEIGEFATSVPTYYRASQDECWRIEYHDNILKYSTDQDVKHFLSELRKNIQSGKSVPRQCLTIDIPKRAFVTDSAQINVLDLPGVYGAGGVKEQDSSRDFAETHLRHASMVLMVTRADDLTSIFDPDTHDITTLRAWPEFRHRFKFVLTYAMSSDNFQKKMTSKLSIGENWTTDLFRDHFRTELDHDLFGRLGIKVEKFLPSLYPLELGKSWRGMSKDHKEKFSGVRTALLTELREKIGQADRPMARFSNLYQYSTVLENFKQSKMLKYGRDHKALQEGQAPLVEDLKVENDIIDAYSEWTSSFNKVIAEIQVTLREECKKPYLFGVENINSCGAGGVSYSAGSGITVENDGGIGKLRNLLSKMEAIIDSEVKLDFSRVVEHIDSIFVAVFLDTPFGDKLDFASSVSAEIRRHCKIEDRVDSIFTEANSLWKDLDNRWFGGALGNGYVRKETRWADERRTLDVLKGEFDSSADIRNYYLRLIEDRYNVAKNKALLVTSEAMQSAIARRNLIAAEVQVYSEKLLINEQKQREDVDQIDKDMAMANGIFQSMEKSYHKTRSFHWEKSKSMMPELAYVELLKILQIDRDFDVIQKENVS